MVRMKPGAEIVIRRAGPEDADEVFSLVQRFATSFSPERTAFDTCLRYILADEDAWLSVAEVDGRIVGYCLGFDHYAFYANGRVAWVEEAMVDDEMRGGGIGSTLMHAFEEWSRLRGSALVGLATRRAAPFYQSLGYEESAVFFRKVL